ncbi:MAG TPA: hypothetical protein DCO82_02000 [Alphaproteobacteria bacterium]|nr:hypothetical protein [Alphaproteobacteria bacterium]
MRARSSVWGFLARVTGAGLDLAPLQVRVPFFLPFSRVFTAVSGWLCYTDSYPDPRFMTGCKAPIGADACG